MIWKIVLAIALTFVLGLLLGIRWTVFVLEYKAKQVLNVKEIMEFYKLLSRILE